MVRKYPFQRLVVATNLEAVHSTYTGIEGELTYTTDGKNLYIHDGSTQGGINIMADPALEIAKGNVPGHSHVNKFGHNPSMASGATEDIWDGSALYVFPATALMTSISQTSDQAAMQGGTVVVEGLDASWNAVTQTATLNGSDTTTVVTLSTALIRCFRMYVTEDVVTDSPIRVHNAGESQDYAVILAANNQTQMAIYTVPNGKTAYMTGVWASLNAGGGAPSTMNIRLWERDNDNGYAREIDHTMGLDVDASTHWNHMFKPYKKYTQKKDIFLDGTTAAATADVSAGFDLILVDN